MSKAQTADPIPEAPADEEVEGAGGPSLDFCLAEIVEKAEFMMTGRVSYIQHILKTARQAQRAALRRSTETDKPGVREGWKLVPVEPTIEMLDAMPSLPAIKLADPLAGRLKPAQYQNRVRYLAALSASPLTEEQPVGEAGPMPGTTGFTMAAFKAADVPVGTKLYVAPVPHTARPIDTDDQVEELAKECGINNRRFMTPGDYSIWCRQQRQFARLAALPRSTTGGAK